MAILSMFSLILGSITFAGDLQKGGIQKMEACDQFYSERGESLWKAVDCYAKDLAQASTSDQRLKYERIFISLSAVVNSNERKPAERKAIDLAFEYLEKMKANFTQTADFMYWTAVWVAFDAKALDRGSVLPRNIFRNLKFIQSQLRQAIDLDPAIHSYGPSRVLGLMHMEMPGIVGGDKSLAERLLRDAWSKAPAMSINWVSYASILDINGKSNEAIVILKKFLEMPASQFNPYAEALRSPVVETKNDIAQAQKLLKELEGDET
jgi:hypothetical protein